jgi:phospholipid/cholesterol/gamma-HCH transport system substrate-binding protein
MLYIKAWKALAVSKPVLVNGFQIGRVSRMQLQPDGRTIVEFKIEPDYNIPNNTLGQTGKYRPFRRQSYCI